MNLIASYKNFDCGNLKIRFLLFLNINCAFFIVWFPSQHRSCLLLLRLASNHHKKATPELAWMLSLHFSYNFNTMVHCTLSSFCITGNATLLLNTCLFMHYQLLTLLCRSMPIMALLLHCGKLHFYSSFVF